MSKVWRRLQRVGKTAYKFEFTIKVHTVTLECVSGWTPNQVSVLWVRRGRKVRTEATSWTTLPGKDTQGVVNWHALEATITLYMDTNSQKKKFDDKFWTLIVENIGPNGKHKALATKRINMSQMADAALHPQETRRKYHMKPVARKVHLTELQVTFISKFERQGPAIDDDMRSVTSEMSEMTFGGFEDGYMSENEYEPFNDTNPEENEQIMREIAAIGADFRQLSTFNEDTPADTTTQNNNNSFHTNGVSSHEQILIGWARNETENYKDISIEDLKDSWGDGKAFCAIIHKYCPELIKMGQLNDPYSNVKQATKAAVELGLMPSIDPIDFHKRRLDKLSILTFVDQLYQNFKNAQPQSNITVMKHRGLKKSPEHKRTTPSVLPNRRVELDDNEEDKRRKDMIARGRLRASRRRPNRNYDKSTSSLDSAKSPLSPATHTLSSPASEISTNKTSLEATMTQTQATQPSAPPTQPDPLSTVQDEQGSVTGSSGIITDTSPSHLVKCNVTSSFEADVFVTSSVGLDPDELMKEFQLQSPIVSPKETEHSAPEPDVYAPEITDQQIIDAIVGASTPAVDVGSTKSLDHVTQPSDHVSDHVTGSVQSLKSGSGSKLSSEKASLKSEHSATDIIQSLERDVIHSPTSIRISGISSKEAAIDQSALAAKLNESKDEAAAFREAILSGEDEPAEESVTEVAETKPEVEVGTKLETEPETIPEPSPESITETVTETVTEPVPELETVPESVEKPESEAPAAPEVETEPEPVEQPEAVVQPEAQLEPEVQPESVQQPEPEAEAPKSDLDELIKIKFSLEEEAEAAPKEETAPQAPEESTELKHIETDIEAEIAELESQLNSNFLFKSEPAVAKPPTPVREPTPVKESPPTPEPVVEPEPAPLQPTPPSTPPRATRASSLRDKIRGLHSAREKLMSACPSPTISEDSNESKLKLPVLPKPSLSLRSNSQESLKSRASSKSDGNRSVPEIQAEVVIPKLSTEIPVEDKIEVTPAVNLEEITQETPPESPETVQDEPVQKETEVEVAVEAKVAVEDPVESELTDIVESLKEPEIEPPEEAVDTKVVAEKELETEVTVSAEPPHEPETAAPEEPETAAPVEASATETPPVEKAPVPPVELTLETTQEPAEEAVQSPGEVVVPEIPLVVTTPESEENSPDPLEEVSKDVPDVVVEKEEVTVTESVPETEAVTETEAVAEKEAVAEPEAVKPESPPAPRKPAGTEIQSLSELISSFSPKTLAETSFEETTTEEVAGSSRDVEVAGTVEIAGSSTQVAGSSRVESPVVEERLEVSSDSFNASLDVAASKDIGSSISSINSEPPPPPAPEPLALMDGPPGGGDGDDSPGEESEDDTLDQSTLDKQDLQDVRDYMSQCHARISHHNAKLDKRAKVLEKELRVAMDSQNHELEQKLLKSWLHLVHERNTLVRKQDDLNSLQNEEDLEERCCVVLKEMRRYQNMRDTNKTVHDVEREEQLEEEYRDILKKREMLLRIRDDINTVSMEEEAEFQSVIEKPKLLQDQSSCKVS